MCYLLLPLRPISSTFFRHRIITFTPIPPIPEEVARIAHAVFPRGNVFMQVRDILGAIYTEGLVAAAALASRVSLERIGEG